MGAASPRTHRCSCGAGAATIYGPGDVYGLSPRLICAAVYKHLGEKMKFAWDGKLRANTVHVRDVAAACWHVATLPSAADVYNLADSSDSSQVSLARTSNLVDARRCTPPHFPPC